MTLLSRFGSMVPSLLAAALAVSVSLRGPALAAEQKPTSTAAEKAETTPRKQLDLRPPDVTRLFTSEQLNKILTASLREDIEEVEVEEQRYVPNTPTVWRGIASPFWALANPKQSWRIFAPLPPDQTRSLLFVRANATDAYVLEPAGVPPQ